MDRNVRNLCFVVVVRHVFYIPTYICFKKIVLNRRFQMVFKAGGCPIVVFERFAAH